MRRTGEDLKQGKEDGNDVKMTLMDKKFKIKIKGNLIFKKDEKLDTFW